MNRFRKSFGRRRDGMFIPFFMLGDPDSDRSVTLIRSAIDAGAHALELGIPFSDPIADGPVIQASAQRALRAGATVDRCFDMIAQIRAGTDVPFGLLVYYNLIRRRGDQAFCRDARAAGVDAILAADLPIDGADRLCDALADHELGSAFLVSPNTPDERAAAIMRRSTAYTYALAVMGTTGTRDAVSPGTLEFVRRLRRLSNEPFAVGFGVSSPQHAVDILRAGAPGVIVGSALTRMIAENLDHFDRGAGLVQSFVRRVRKLQEQPTCSSS